MITRATQAIIASTSIDEIIELEGVDEAGLSKMYTRSHSSWQDMSVSRTSKEAQI